MEAGSLSDITFVDITMCKELIFLILWNDITMLGTISSSGPSKVILLSGPICMAIMAFDWLRQN
jgi:hypothetical protein